ncbi:MAG: tetratricopeptide repeat protein [Vicinamibacterales bacterium]
MRRTRHDGSHRTRAAARAWRVTFAGLVFSLVFAGVHAAHAQDAPVASVVTSSQPGTSESIARLLRSGDAEGALKLIDEALAQSPGDVRLWTMRGVACAQMKRTDESLAAYRKALALKPDYLPALQGAAQIEYGTGHAEARRTLERIVGIDAQNAVAHAMLGALAYDRHECKAALAHFERADALIRGNPRTMWQSGHCLFLEDRPAEAAARFEQLLPASADDTRAAVIYNLALSWHAAGQHRKAIATLAPLASRNPPERDVVALLADVYAANQQVQEAIDTLRRGTTIYPRDEQFYVSLAALCLEHDSFDLGREVIAIGLRNVSAPKQLYAVRGILRAQLGELDEAQADFEHVSQLEPRQSGAVAGLSLTLQQTGRTEQSIAILREQAKARPNDDAVNVMLAQALMRGAFDERSVAEARAALTRAMLAAPRRAITHTELGKLHLKTGEVEKAIEQLQLAVDLDPSDKTPTYHLLVALRRAGRHDEARTLATRVRELLDEEKASEIARNRFRLVRAEPGAARTR